MHVMMIGPLAAPPRVTLLAAARSARARVLWCADASEAVTTLAITGRAPTAILVSSPAELSALQDWLARRFELHAVPVLLIAPRDDFHARAIAIEGGCADVMVLDGPERAHQQLLNCVGFRPSVDSHVRLGETVPCPPAAAFPSEAPVALLSRPPALDGALRMPA